MRGRRLVHASQTIPSIEAASQDGAELEAIDPDTLKQLRSLGYLR